MKRPIEFIGRLGEIAAVGKIIAEWGTTRIVCLSGERGIGKSSLLEYLVERYSIERQAKDNMLVSKRIDFYNPELHIKDTLASSIIDELGEADFADYIEALVNKRRMEVDQYPLSMIREEDAKADRAFVQCFNRLSSNRRVVLFVDTIEHIYESETWDFLQRLVAQVSNAVVIMSGRELEEISAVLADRLGKVVVKLIQLKPFERSDAEDYLRQKQRDMHIALDAQLTEKVLALASGKPLLIDLAVDWLARNVPMPWLLERTTEELKNLSEDERMKLEKALVSPIAELREPRDHLLWIMALIRPLSREMAERLTDWSVKDFGSAWQDVSQLSFVKVLHGDQLMIHDVVRDILLGQLQYDIEPERRSVWISGALSYLGEQSERLRNQLQEIHTAELDARSKQNNMEFWSLLIKEGRTERALWTVEGQMLAYRILQEPDTGLSVFEKEFERTTHQNNFQKRGVLLAQLHEARDRLLLSDEQKTRIDVRRAMHFLDIGKYVQAEGLISRMVGKYEPKKEIEFQLILGNILIRKGSFEEGLSHFEAAIHISKENQLPDLLTRALNAYGWGCRLMGRIEEASKHYRDALQLALNRGLTDQQALILNNLGYVYALMRKRETAVRLCQQALDLFEQNKDQRGIGRVYSTLGDIFTEFNDPPQAFNYYEKALKIFEPIPVRDMLSIIHCGRGRAFWLVGELASALKELEEAQRIGLTKDKPNYLHYFAEVYLSQGNFLKAKELFEESYRQSLEVLDPFFELNSLGDLAKIALLEGELVSREEFRRRYEDFKIRHRGIRYRLPEALLLGYLGDMYFLAGEPRKALSFYKQGLPQLAEAGSYEPYTIQGQLLELENKVLSRASPKVIRELGRKLEDFWNDKHHGEQWPEALPFFAKWKNWPDVRKGTRT